ncbi:hypothetical protein BH10ACT7_BH10ACT7_24170 [soil metagenome]
MTRAAERKLATAAQLTSLCRQLTAEHGLNGFTIEEVCIQVGVSRRTFFNYFPSKEDAVLGGDPAEDVERLAREFLDRGSRGWDAVLDDFLDLLVANFESTGVTAAGHAQLVKAIEREPRLLVRAMGMNRQVERQAAELVSAREGVPVGDLRVQASINLVTALLKATTEQYLLPDNSREFSDILHDHLTAMRTVLAPTRKATR